MDSDRCHLHVHSRLQAADCWRSSLAIRGITFAAALLLTGCGQPVIEMVPAAESERSADPDRRRRPPRETLPRSPDEQPEAFYASDERRIELGKSVEGRSIHMHVFGGGRSATLIFAAIHGDERNTAVVANALIRYLRENPSARGGRPVAVIPMANPDGYARKTRTNANRVDLNRNFPADNWRPGRLRGRHFGSTHAASEPETQVIIRAVETLRPKRVISIHNAGGGGYCNNYDGPAESLARLMHGLNGYPVKASIGYPTPGSFGSWAGVDAGIPVVTLELPRSASGSAAWEANREALLAAIRADLGPALPRRAAATASRNGGFPPPAVEGSQE